ncbi:pre-mRNA-splicing factor 38B-like isoform X2 [Panonychus citri]|nr:pre-mRNA-splicing factor 38B-like isoform X2 [Panonychus citri]
MQQDMTTIMLPGTSTNAVYYGNMDYTNNLTANNNVNHYNEAQGSEESNDIVSQGASQQSKKGSKASNVLPFWGNERTMNLNTLLLTNIKNSPYFKVNLYSLKTYHEVIDEIWNQVKHMEPWEKGSRRVSGQTGMCGSVRGVGAGGIVSTPFCILYKLYTLRLTRKQLMGLIKHKDSPFIRALGFMYIRYTQPPSSFWEWLSPYLDDSEEFDAKAGGGQKMTIGQMCRHLLVKLEWFSTLFPRIPVPIQKEIETKLNEYDNGNWGDGGNNYEDNETYEGGGEEMVEEGPKYYDNDNSKPARSYEEDDDYNSRDRKIKYKSERKMNHRYRSRSRSREDSSRKSFDETRGRSRAYQRDSPSDRVKERSYDRVRDRSLDKYRLKSPKRSPDRSQVRSRDRSRDRSFDRSRDRSNDRRKRHRSHRSPNDKKRSREHKHKRRH